MSAASKIPPLRFKGFEGAWKSYEFGGVYERINAKKYQIESSRYLNLGCFPVVDQGKDLIVAYTNDANKVFSAAESRVIVFGDHTREVKFVEFDFAIGADGTQLMRCCANFEISFAYYVMKRLTLPNMGYSRHYKFLLEAQYLFPNLREQQKIASAFRSLDALIADRKSAVEKLQTLKKAMLEKMFPRAGAKVPEVRFKGCEGEWKEKRLGDSVRFAKGKGYSKSDIQEEGTPLFLYGRMYTDYQIEVDRVDTFCVQRNGSVLSVGNEVVCPASGETAEDIACASAVKEKGIVLGGDLNILVPHANSGLDPTFLAMSLTYGSGRAKIVERAQGKTVVHIHNSDLEDVVVLSPSLLEQRKIGAYFRSLDALISARQEEVGKLKNLKKALLDRMFV